MSSTALFKWKPSICLENNIHLSLNRLRCGFLSSPEEHVFMSIYSTLSDIGQRASSKYIN